LPPVGQCRTIVPIVVSILLFFIFKHQQHFSPKVDNLLPGIVEHSLIFSCSHSAIGCAQRFVGCLDYEQKQRFIAMPRLMAGL